MVHLLVRLRLLVHAPQRSLKTVAAHPLAPTTAPGELGRQTALGCSVEEGLGRPCSISLISQFAVAHGYCSRRPPSICIVAKKSASPAKTAAASRHCWH